LSLEKNTLTPVLLSPWSHLALYLCLPSPPWAYWDPGLPWKAYSMVPYDFLKLFPQLVCQAPLSKASLNQPLGTGRGRGTNKNCSCHTHALTLPPQGVEEKQTGTFMHRDAGPWAQRGMPAIAKRIHRKGLAHIQSCHSPKRDERKNKCMQVHVHAGGQAAGSGLSRQGHLSWVCVGGQWCIAQAPLPSPTSHLRPLDPALVS
jgi:hypothetical protein